MNNFLAVGLSVGRLPSLVRVIALTSVTVMVLGAETPVVSPAQTPPYDVVVLHGRLLDGTGNPWRYSDIAVAGDRIVAIGNLEGASAHRIIDATGLWVAPGFIDTHTHAGPALEDPSLSLGLPYLTQGVTTVVINPDGGGPVDLSAQQTRIEAAGVGPNVAQLVPHGSIREKVLGMQDRKASDEELNEMRRLVRSGMEAGAYGLSSGLFYAPGSYAPVDELVQLAGVAAAFGGIYQSHIRDESDYSIGVAAAVDEVIHVAREARLPGIVTHLKALGPGVWGASGELVRRIEAARQAGVEVYADQYPYHASATGLGSALIPRWAMAGGSTELERRLSEPATRTRMEAEIRSNLERRGGPDSIQFRRYSPDPTLEGRRLADVAEERGIDPVQLVLQLAGGSYVGIVSFNMSEQDIVALMSPDWVMTASDGQLVPLGEGVPHPRSYGTFPRKIRRYVREERTIDLSAAIRSMTSLPATVFRLKERGQIREGGFADLVVFDLEKLTDRSTYDQPHQYSEGMRHVMVNGKLVISDSALSQLRPGRILRLNQ